MKLESQAVFKKNVAAIRKRSLDLADALLEASIDGIEEEVGPRGARILTERGVRLGSAYDPVREGQQIAERMAAEPADIMIAVGFGLGEQFEPFYELNPGTLIIFEPSIERLKAALHRISIVNLCAKHKDLFFATGLDQFNRLLSARYTPGLRVRVFPHPAVMRLDQSAVARVVDTIRDTKEVVDVQRLTSIEMLMPWAWVTARNGRRIAESPQLGELAGVFDGKPAVVVAAGPSLDKQLPLLREIQDKAVIIGIGQTAKALRRAGIEPHLIHVLESRDVSHQLTDVGDTTSMITAPSADADPAIFDVPCRARFTVTPAGGALGVWIGKAGGEKNFSMGGGTVAQGAVGMADMLGCDPIALIGQDLAFTDGRAYAKDSAYDFVEVENEENGDFRFRGMNKKAGLLKETAPDPENDGMKNQRVVWVDGWNEGEKVATWKAYASFLEQYREIGLHFRNTGHNLINCTEGGARIPEIEHLAFASFIETYASESFDPRGMILDVHDRYVKKGLSDYAEAVADARKLLDRVESEAKKGTRFAKKTRDKLLNAKNDQQRVEILRGLARHEKRVRVQLERIPWLDMLVQPEIYNAIAAVRRTERQDPTDEDLADESAFLFQAAQNGIRRARSWFEAFEKSFEEVPPDVIRRGGSDVFKKERSDAKQDIAAVRYAAPPS